MSKAKKHPVRIQNHNNSSSEEDELRHGQSKMIKSEAYHTLQDTFDKTCETKAVRLLWFLTVTCSCCPYLYFGSAIMLVTYFVNFR